MSTYLRKCIDIAPTAVITPGPIVAERLPQPAAAAVVAGAARDDEPPAAVGGLAVAAARGRRPPGLGAAGAASLAALDAQVEAAHADGMQIILLPYRYPRWANGTEGIADGAPRTATSAVGPRTRGSRSTSTCAPAGARARLEDLRVPDAAGRPRPGQPVGPLRRMAVGSLRRPARPPSRSSTSRTCSCGRSAARSRPTTSTPAGAPRARRC